MAEKPGPSNLAASAAAVTVTTEDVAAVQPVSFFYLVEFKLPINFY